MNAASWLKKRWRWLAGALIIVALLLLGRQIPLVAWLESIADPLRKMG